MLLVCILIVGTAFIVAAINESAKTDSKEKKLRKGIRPDREDGKMICSFGMHPVSSGVTLIRESKSLLSWEKDHIFLCYVCFYAMTEEAREAHVKSMQHLADKVSSLGSTMSTPPTENETKESRVETLEGTYHLDLSERQVLILNGLLSTVQPTRIVLFEDAQGNLQPTGTDEVMEIKNKIGVFAAVLKSGSKLLASTESTQEDWYA